MIDNVKFQIIERNEFENLIISNKLIDLTSTINYYTGEISLYPKKGKHKNLEISITPNYAYLWGSLHKFNNLNLLNEDQNYNAFNYCQINDIVELLTHQFNIKNKTSLTNLEFGFNINTKLNPQHILDYNVLMYKYKNHNREDKFSGKGDFKEFKTTDFNIKIYNKSKQYSLNENLLRIELKITSKRYLQKLDVFKLEDLQDKSVLYGLFRRFLKEFNELVIVDDFYSLDIPKTDLENLTKFTNPNFWKNLKDKKSLKVCNRVKRDFELLQEKYNLNKTKKELYESTQIKFNELVNCGYFLTVYNVA